MKFEAGYVNCKKHGKTINVEFNYELEPVLTLCFKCFVEHFRKCGLKDYTRRKR